MSILRRLEAALREMQETMRRLIELISLLLEKSKPSTGVLTMKTSCCAMPEGEPGMIHRNNYFQVT